MYRQFFLRLFVLCWLLGPHVLLFGQSQRSIDSLKKISLGSPKDTIRIKATIQIAEKFFVGRQADSARVYIDRSMNMIEKALAVAKEGQKKALLHLKAYALYGKGAMIERTAPAAETEKIYHESIDLYLATNDKKGAADLYRKLGGFLRSEGRHEEAMELVNKALNIYESMGARLNVSQSLMYIADVWRDMGQYSQAIDYYKRAIALKEELNDLKTLAVAYTNLGFVYYQKGNVTSALECIYKALKIREKINDKLGIGTLYINMGDIHLKQGDTLRALENFNKALKLGEEINDKKSVGGAYIYLGYIAQARKQNETALDYYNKSLKLREEIRDKTGQAYCLYNMSKVYMERGDTTTASEKFKKAYDLWKIVGDKRGIASSLNYMGDEYLKKKDLANAEKYASEALAVAKAADIKEQIKLAYLLRSRISLAKEEYKAAYEYHEAGIKLRDSLTNNENKKAALEKDLEYQYEKKQALLQLEKEKQDLAYREELRRSQLMFELQSERENNQHAIEKRELAHQEELKRKQLKAEFEKTKEVTRIETEKQKLLADARSRQQRNIITMVSVGLLIVVVFLGLLFNRFRLIKKQKNIIESQKQQVELKNAEVTMQKLLVEEKNKEIIDSINYARRLQEAILPPASMWEQQLPHSFILYRPKDIVAGDFYFMEQQDNKVFFAAADCTGHGVPGAMVSVVCSNALTRSVKEFGLKDPGKILDKVRELVLETFSKSESDVKDGMDISLCALDQQTGTLEWAGANNPLWIFRKKSGTEHEFIELKPDKQPIGKSPDPYPFTSHEVITQPGDMIYLFTDGYADQFGGDKGKKFKSSNMRELLAGLQSRDLSEQKSSINNAFERWKGELEQVDDVCVIGIRI